MANKWVYLFKEGNASMRELLGGKGANLAEMTSLGLPVPQGFTITTEACTQPARIIGLLSNYIYNSLIQSQVQNGVHHTRHGSSCARTNGNQKRILSIAEFLTCNLFHLANVLINLTLDLLVDLTSILIILRTSFRRLFPVNG